MGHRNDPVEITATLEHETDNAYLLAPDTEGPAVWVPKSRCTALGKGRFQVPEWLAEKEGFI